MAFFPLFSNFPAELQLAIWALGVPDPEPEVCIVWPLSIEQYSDKEPALPLIVDTTWPAVAHVCRNARSAVLESGVLRLRQSPTAGFAVPYRHFIPVIDTLYWGRYQAGAMHRFLRQPENAIFARDLRHIAVELTATYPQSELAELIRQRAVFLRTLSVVLPTTTDSSSTAASFLPPARRCRLRDITGQMLHEIKLTQVPALESHEKMPMPLQEYLDKRRGDLDSHVRKFAVLGDEGTAWSTRDGCFSGLEIKVQTFLEYAMAEDNQAQWVEVCGNRLLGHHLDDDTAPEPRHIPVADRKNPEEYRVLDDDSGWYSTEEFKLTLQRGYTMELGMIPPGPY